jgi:hypothetical protein
MVRGSTVLLGLGVLLWLLLCVSVSAPYHGLQACASFRFPECPSGMEEFEGII